MNKKISIPTIIILFVIIVLGTILIFNTQSNNETSGSVNYSNQQKIQTTIIPGLTGTTCLETVDCAGECGDDPCFVSSCTRKNNSDSGTCVCLRICEE